MSLAGPAFQVEDVLRARANARRIKEHYEGTLGVPSELQSLGHLLAHDRQGVFAGLENLPFYNKSNIPPPQQLNLSIPQPAEELPTPHTVRYRRRQAATTEPSVSTPEAVHQGQLQSVSSDPRRTLEPNEAAQPLPQQPQQPQQRTASIWPTVPAEDAQSEGTQSLALNPQLWPDSDAGLADIQATPGSVSAGSPPSLGLAHTHDDQQEHHHHHHRHHHRHHHHHHNDHHHHHRAEQPELSPGEQEPEASSERERAPSDALRDAASPASSPGSPARGEGFGAWGPLSVRSASLAGSVAESETEEAMKHRLAQQRLLSAHDLSPQEWARIGPPQDAVDLEKFMARDYSITVDYDRVTFAPKRVARPDIFHISADEAHRRRMEAHEATLAQQAQRRAEAEAAERAAEEERLARMSARGPQYDTLGVLVQERTSVSPVRARFLDWHPDGLGGMQGQGYGQFGGAWGGQGTQQGGPGQPRNQLGRSLTLTRRSASGVSGGGVADTTGAVPTPNKVSRNASVARSRSDSINEYARALRAMATKGRQPPPSPTPAAAAAQQDTDVYEDMGDEDGADQDMWYGAAYGTHPPQRRHHSALASFSPPPRPPGVSDAHYAQIVRQQRRWLNGPAKPPRPVSAAPMPAPLTYHRPRSSRPPPEGTAAPMPSRVAAEAAAVEAVTAELNRLGNNLQTVIHERLHASRTTSSRLRASWAPSRPLSAATGDSMTSSLQHRTAGGGGAGYDSRPLSAQASATAAPSGKRLPWAAREHAVASLAAAIIPTRVTLEGEDTSSSTPRTPGGNRVSFTGNAAGAARGRPGTAVGGAARRPPAPRPGRGGAGGRGASAVYGETLVHDSGRNGSETLVARKFELHDGIVLDGYMGRMP